MNSLDFDIAISHLVMHQKIIATKQISVWLVINHDLFLRAWAQPLSNNSRFCLKLPRQIYGPCKQYSLVPRSKLQEG